MSAYEDEFEKILKEAELEDDSQDMAAVLRDLANSPHQYGRVEPPAGYENQLIAALKTRLPLEAKKASEPVREESSVWAFFSSRRAAWSFSGAMAVFVAVFAFQSIRNVEAPEPDFLIQTASRGNSEAVERWVSSVADLGVQVIETNQTALVDELKKADPSDASRALDAVERSLGVRKDI